MKRTQRRALGLAATLSVAALVTATVTASAGTESVSQDGEGYYQVSLEGNRSLSQLKATGADITRATSGGAEVATDSRGAQELRDRGYQVTYRSSLYAPVPKQATRAAAGTYYGGYHTVAAHEAHNAKVAADHPTLAKVHDIGDSYLKTTGKGGHDIQAVCITESADKACSLSTAGKPKMVLMGQIHAREVSTGELAYRWIDELTTSADPEIVQLRKTRELWVIPIANPDGVDKVASRPDRPISQRKNMNYTSADEAKCGGTSAFRQAGVDLNRNSDLAWDPNEGTACGQTFPGVKAASEPETQAVQGFLAKVYPDKKDDDYKAAVKPGASGVFLTLHAYGNYVIHPYSFTNTTKAPDAAALKTLGKKMTAFNKYRLGTAGETVGYTAPGGTDDWAYGRLGVAGYTFEVGGSSGTCGGFFPAYSCMDGFWEKNRGAFIAAAQGAADPYGQKG
ncbi:M14 family zinc carboxypeptidase [Demetria terragena]|uniref:M14 family zinc carboxypeptidase n=1 Tax=Demetria terragena TaxID=63959 RepID=UPI0003674C6B|nr:M14 family zinc carboxypeptidase [Demetria terragena]